MAVAIRDSSTGKFSRWAFPGGYPIFYLVQDGGVLCASDECANGPEVREAEGEGPPDADPQWLVIAADIHWEGEPLVCDHCGKSIESAYGNPDDEVQV